VITGAVTEAPTVNVTVEEALQPPEPTDVTVYVVVLDNPEIVGLAVVEPVMLVVGDHVNVFAGGVNVYIVPEAGAIVFASFGVSELLEFEV